MAPVKMRGGSMVLGEPVLMRFEEVVAQGDDVVDG